MERQAGPLRVYIVEDSVILRNLLTELITSIGAAIVGHSDSAQVAIGEIATLGIDVVLVDIHLHEGNGIEVLHAMHSGTGTGTGRPRRVVLTNHSLPSYRDAAARLGVDRFFDKSVDITKLIEYLAALQAGHAGGPTTTN